MISCENPISLQNKNEQTKVIFCFNVQYFPEYGGNKKFYLIHHPQLLPNQLQYLAQLRASAYKEFFNINQETQSLSEQIQSHETILKAYLDPHNEKIEFFVLFKNTDNCLIPCGEIYLSSHEDSLQKTISIVIYDQSLHSFNHEKNSKKLANPSLGENMLRSIIEFAKYNLQVNQLCANIDQGNIASQKLFEKLGFIFNDKTETYILSLNP